MTQTAITPTILPMTEKTTQQAHSTSLGKLEGRLDELLHLSRTLKQENARLREQQAKMREEQMTLISSRDQVRSQVESMITRLKSMESE